MSKKQYIEINGHRLDYDPVIGYYEAEIDGKSVSLGSMMADRLGLEIHTEGPKFEDLPEGVYATEAGTPKRPNEPAKVGYVVLKKTHHGWRDLINDDWDAGALDDMVRYWHEDGALFLLHKHEATNA